MNHFLSSELRVLIVRGPLIMPLRPLIIIQDHESFIY